MSNDNPQLPTEPSSDLNTNLPDANLPEITEHVPASPLDVPIQSTPTVSRTTLPPPVVPDLPPPPPVQSGSGNTMPPPPPLNTPTTPPPSHYYNTVPRGAYSSPSQYNQGQTTGKSSGNAIFKGCCIGCAIIVVIGIIVIAITMRSCGDIFGGIGSMVGDAIDMKTKSKADIEAVADNSFALDQLASNPEAWQGKYVIFETTADIIESNDPESQVITIKSPMAVILNTNPNPDVQSGMPIRVWGKVSKFDMSAISKFAPDLPKDAIIAGFVVATAVEPADGSSTSDNNNGGYNPDDGGGKPPADGQETPPDDGSGSIDGEQYPSDEGEQIPPK